MKQETYNLVIIGAGSGGLMVAAGAIGLGAKVALVERRKMGGDCLNYGCVPSKALIRSAKAVALAQQTKHGVGASNPTHPWQDISGYVQRVIDTIAPHDSVEHFQSLGVDVFLGEGRVISPHSVEVQKADGSKVVLRGKALVISTGSEPFIPPIPGLKEAGYQTNQTIFTMPQQPQRLAVIGGGPIGSELGQSFARLGSTVSLIQDTPRLLIREDADTASVVMKSMEADGVNLYTSSKLIRVDTTATGKTLHLQMASGEEKQVEVDDILVATGRRPATANIGLEELGIKMNRGLIAVNAQMQTSRRSIYVCGDATGPLPFTHTANQQARVVIQNALLPFKTKMRYDTIPWCTFTQPELARVGLSEDEAKSQGIPHRVFTFPFAEVDRAVCEDERDGLIKVLIPPKKDTILGVAIVGPHAGELIHEFVVAKACGLRMGHIANTIHIYPTLAEINRRLADKVRSASFTPTVAKIFKHYLAWKRW